MSCFACFSDENKVPSAQPVSSEVAPSAPSANATINPSPTAMSLEENHVTSSSATVMSPAHDKVFEVGSSSNAVDNSNNVEDDRLQAGMPTVSSSLTKVSDITAKIQEDAHKVDDEDIDIHYLQELSDYINRLLKFIEVHCSLIYILDVYYSTMVLL